MSANGAVIVSSFAGIPMVVLAHELGHAVAGLKFTKNPVLVRVGRADAAVKLRIGRLLVVFSPFGAGGFCRAQGRVTRRQALMRVLAGPTVNPSDGLQALCLLRNRPLPPPRPPRPAVGMRTSLSGYQIAVILAGVPVWLLLAADHLNQTALCIWLPLLLQGALGGSGPSTKTQIQPAKPSTQTGVASRASAMKTCPKCGAQVRSAARLCFCYHAFG